MIVAQDGVDFVKLSAKGCSSSGDKWDDGAGGHVRQILVTHDTAIRSIQIVYERQAATVVSTWHGRLGDKVDVISFDKPLMWISGYYASNPSSVIKSLSFGTNHSVHGPFGEESGKYFHFKTNTGIYGFHGCRGCYEGDCFLTAIGKVKKRPMLFGPSDAGINSLSADGWVIRALIVDFLEQ